MASYSGNPHTNDATLRSNSGSSFAAARSGASLSVISASATTTGPQVDNASSPLDWYVDRYVMSFDTSSLGSGATVSAGTLDFYINAISAPGAATCYLDLVGVNLASAPTISTSDWGNVVIGTALATRLSMATSATGAKTFTLNASGLAAINATGYTTFAIVMGNDLSNSTSSPSVLGADFTYMNCNASNAGSNKPLLSLTYTGGTPPGAQLPARRRPLGLYTR